MANFIPRLEWDTDKSYTFKYPSTKQAAPTFLPTEAISESIGGHRQVQINNIVKKVALEFKFIPKADLDILENDFFLSWAVLGKTFKYFESSDEYVFEEYELDSYDWKPVREIPKEGNFLYKITLNFRRVYL